MTMTNTDLLRRYVKDSGLKYKYIAQKIGISPYGLSQKVKGIREFKGSEIDQLCQLLHIEDDLETQKAIFFTQKVDYKSTK